MRHDITTTSRIWKESEGWWAQRFESGRCEWLMGPFRSAKNARQAASNGGTNGLIKTK